MKIDKTFKIKEKYFNAILRFEKQFELRHEKVEPNSIIELKCENGRYLIFKSGKCDLLTKPFQLARFYTCGEKGERNRYDFTEEEASRWLDMYGEWTIEFNWYDTFCWKYINQARTYLIEIAEILKVK